MKRLLLILLLTRLLPADGVPYRLEYLIRGSAISRVLLLFPLRVYYEASAAVDLTAIPREDGSTCFAYAGIPQTAYILRTLGFSGKTIALLTVGADADEDDAATLADDILSRWRVQAPEFAARIKTVKKFSHRLLAPEPQPVAFERDASGFYRNFKVELEPRYRYYPANTGVYFDVFSMLGEMLQLLNHRFAPAPAGPLANPLPAEWEGEELDFSAELNRVAELLGKAVKAHVTIDQKFPFRMLFRVAASDAEKIEICGEAYPDVSLWKGFTLREVRRRVRLQPANHELLSDEILVVIRNAKGQGGFGRLLLKRIDAKEDNR